ncbi:MAG: hypothetical protein V1909_01885 [Candidatus Micrarchaeota archaeon]
MTDTPERALHEAESWLVSAKHKLMEAEADETSANVCCSQAIHAIIRTNDALSLKFLGHTPTRHDDAAIVFAKLVREGKLPDRAKPFKDLIADSMRDKSDADYGKASFSYEDAKEYVERAESFVAMAKDVLKL